MVSPGKFRVSLQKFSKGKLTELVTAQPFECHPINLASIPAQDQGELKAFNKKVGELTRVIQGVESFRTQLLKKMSYLHKAIERSLPLPDKTLEMALAIDTDLRLIDREINGDPLVRRFKGATPTSVRQRVELITGALWNTTAAPTNTFIKSYEMASTQMESILESLDRVDSKIKDLETILEDAGAPYTPGRIPKWKK